MWLWGYSRAYSRLLVVVIVALAAPHGRTAEPTDAFGCNRLLARGVNLGNALDAPKEGEWGLTLEEDFFEQIRRAGFKSVRIPIRWSAHAG